MATNSVTSIFARSAARLPGMMEDSAEAVLRDCIRAANELETACPQQRTITTRLIVYLEVLERLVKLKTDPAVPHESYANFKGLYDASVEYLKRHADEGDITEEKLQTGLMAGNAFQSELPGFQRRLRQAINHPKRNDIERIKKGGDRGQDILRLRPQRIGPTKVR